MKFVQRFTPRPFRDRRALAGLVAVLASAALAQPAAPTDEELAQWRARFVTGLYRVVEFQLDHTMQPIAESAKSRQACVSASEMNMISAMPTTVPTMWQCEATRFNFDGDLMSVFMRCLRDGKTLAGGAILGVSDQPRVIESTLMLTDPSLEGPESLRYGVATSMERIGECP